MREYTYESVNEEHEKIRWNRLKGIGMRNEVIPIPFSLYRKFRFWEVQKEIHVHRTYVG